MFKNEKLPHYTKVEISKQEFDQLKHTALLIDVRYANEYQILKKISNKDGKLNIINIPYYDLINNPSKYIKNKKMKIITICNAGNRSTAAAINLRTQGYANSYVLKHGVYGYYA